MTTVLYLIRHGITAANKENRFAGRTSEPLHPEGIGQIRELGLGLRPLGISRVVAGPLPRTRESAEIVGSLCAAPVSRDADFNDIFIPHWDGLTKDAIRTRFGPEYPTWLSRPAEFRLPGCEDLAAVRQRAVRGIERLFAGCGGQTVLVISHLIVLRCLVLHYEGLGLEDFRAVSIGNGAVVRLLRDKAGKTTVSRSWSWELPAAQ